MFAECDEPGHVSGSIDADDTNIIGGSELWGVGHTHRHWSWSCLGFSHWIGAYESENEVSIFSEREMKEERIKSGPSVYGQFCTKR